MLVERHRNEGHAVLVKPRLLLHLKPGRIVGPADLSQTPDWAKPIVADALQRSQSRS